MQWNAKPWLDFFWLQRKKTFGQKSSKNIMFCFDENFSSTSKNRFETIPEILEPVLPQISQLDVSFNRIEASIGLKAEWAFEIFELYAVFCKSSWSLE